jgi:predicted acylesterase/phospholipase RssA
MIIYIFVSNNKMDLSDSINEIIKETTSDISKNTPIHYKNIVIAGGGLKIISVVGSIKYLEDIGVLSSVTGFYGSSAGALLCMMINLGYSSREIEKFISELSLTQIFDINTDNLFDNFNVCSNVKFISLVKLLITFKGFDSSISLSELYERTGKTLVVTCTSMRTCKSIKFSHNNHGEIELWRVVLMSASIPLVFEPITWKGEAFVDGSLVDNFPLLYIPKNEIEETIGFNVIISNNFSYTNIYEYITTLLNVMLNGRVYIKSYNVVSIVIGGEDLSDVLDISITKENRLKLIAMGYEQTKKKLLKQHMQKMKQIYDTRLCSVSTQTDDDGMDFLKIKRRHSF